MKVELRCDRHKHGSVDLDSHVIEIKCWQCSKDLGKPVFHHWLFRDGIVVGMDGGEDGGSQASSVWYRHRTDERTNT